MKNNLLTFKQFIEKNKAIKRWPFTEGSLRSIYRRRDNNGMEKAFTKVTSRILVDEEKFYENKKN